MELPGADFTRGMSGLGREGEGLGVKYAAQIRGIEKVQTAEQAVFKEFDQLTDAAMGWTRATENAHAAAALAGYHTEVSNKVSSIVNARSIEAGAIPAGVKYNRTEKGDDGTEQERTSVPAWEVAAGLFDHHEKIAYDKAMSRVSGPVRAQLQNTLSESRLASANKIKDFRFKGNLEYLQDETLKSVATLAKAEKYPDAQKVISTAVKDGVLSLDEARKLEETTMQQADLTAATRAIIGTNDPRELERLAQGLLVAPGDVGHMPYPYMTPKQRVDMASKADTKAIELQKAGAREQKAQRKETAEKKLKGIEARASAGNMPTEAELASLENDPDISPAQYDHARNLKNTAVKPAKNTQAGEDLIATLHLTPPGTSETVEDRYQRKTDLLERGKHLLTNEEYQKQKNLVELEKKRLFDNPEVRDAEDLIKRSITSKFDTNSSKDKLIQDQFSADMRAAIANNKGQPLDLRKWVQDNLPKYRGMQRERVYTALEKLSLPHYYSADKDGKYDAQETRRRLDEAYRKKEIQEQQYTKAINAMDGVK